MNSKRKMNKEQGDEVSDTTKLKSMSKVRAKVILKYVDNALW